MGEEGGAGNVNRNSQYSPSSPLSYPKRNADGIGKAFGNALSNAFGDAQ